MRNNLIYGNDVVFEHLFLEIRDLLAKLLWSRILYFYLRAFKGSCARYQEEMRSVSLEYPSAKCVTARGESPRIKIKYPNTRLSSKTPCRSCVWSCDKVVSEAAYRSGGKRFESHWSQKNVTDPVLSSTEVGHPPALPLLTLTLATFPSPL